MTYGETDESKSVEIVGRKGSRAALMGASKLIAREVKNIQGDHLGTIMDIVLNIDSGKIAYAILAKESVVLISEKLFAVPWKCLKLDASNNQFIVDADITQFNNAAGFDSKHWPDVAVQSWVDGIQSTAGIQP